MIFTLQQLEYAIEVANFKKNDDWQIIVSGSDILHAKCSAIIKVSSVQLGTLARAMQVNCNENDGCYSLTFQHNNNTVKFETIIL